MPTTTAVPVQEIKSGLRPSLGFAAWTGFSPTELRVGLIVVALSFIARFQSLLPGYSIDDYGFANQAPPEWLGHQAVAQGRILSHVLLAALARLGAAPPRAAPLGIFLLTVVLVAVGLWTCRSWGLRDRFGESLIVVSCIALHPYQAEIFTFRTAVLFFAVALAVTFVAIESCTRSKARWLLSLCALTCALSIYQNVLNYVFLAMLFAVVFRLAGCGARERDWWLNLRSRATLVLASVVLYMLSASVVTRISTVPFSQRTAFLRLDEIGSRLVLLYHLGVKVFLQDEPILPIACKVLLLSVFAVGFAAYAADSLMKRKNGPLARTTLALTLAGLVGVPLCVGLQLILHAWWPVPRVLSQTSIFWAGMIGLIYASVNMAVRRVLLVGLVVIFISFIGINNQIFNDQLRVNMRDLATANRILMRIEALPESDQITAIVFNGGVWSFPSPIRTVEGDMNISGFYASWANLELMNELTGDDFKHGSPEMVAKADSYCKSAAKWPALKSVTKIDTAAVVCFASN